MGQFNRYIALVSLTLITAISLSCTDDNVTTTDSSGSPSVSSIEPDSGIVGSRVMVNGSGFSTTADANKVLFDGNKATVEEATESQLTVIVPDGLGTGSVSVQVVIGGQPSEDIGFEVLTSSPRIDSVEPDTASVGTPVTIEGLNFSSDLDSLALTFTATPAEIISATETTIETTVPDGAVSGTIKLEVGEEVALGPKFTVTYPSPTISSISPESGMIGDLVTINGTNFRATPDSNTVSFNGAEADVMSASETQLEATVPADASSGPVRVIVKGDTATGPTFTLTEPMSVDQFVSTTRDFENVTAADLSWEIINPQQKNIVCELDADGDGMTDHTIDPCPESGSKMWLYRREITVSQVTPELSISAKDGSESDSQTMNNSVEVTAKAVTDVSADAFHVLALDNQGHITAWGDDTEKTNVPSEIQDQGIAIATGFNQSFVVTEDNTVTGFGNNADGQLDVPSSVQGQAIDVSSGSNFGVALKTDGTVEAWGGNNNGQLDVPAGLDNVVAIVSGEYHTLALKADGTVAAWGWDNHGQSTVPVEFQSNGRVVALSAAHASSAVLKFDKSVSAWGRSTVGADTPPSDLGPVVEIAGGGFHHNALQEDGVIRNWGRDKGAVSLDRPGLSNVINITTDFEYGIAVQEDGTVVSWGASGNANQADNIPAGLDLIK